MTHPAPTEYVKLPRIRKNYYNSAEEAIFDALRRALNYAKDRKEFFKLYEPIHQSYGRASSDADGYIRFAEGQILLGLAIIFFNTFWDSIPNAPLYFIAVLAAVGSLFLFGPWFTLRRVHRAKPPQFEFRTDKGTTIVLEVQKPPREAIQQAETTRFKKQISKRDADREARKWMHLHLPNVELRWGHSTVSEVDDDYEVVGEATGGENESYAYQFRISRNGQIREDKCSLHRRHLY